MAVDFNTVFWAVHYGVFAEPSEANGAAFDPRFYKANGKMPNLTQAAHYSAMTHYCRTLREMARTDPASIYDGRAVVAKMKTIPTSDPIFGDAYLRADGRHIHDFHLFQVKTPAQSNGPWDLYNLVQTFPGAARHDIRAF